jgi:transposase-like protein
VSQPDQTAANAHRGHSRKRLSPDQQREIARLYAETGITRAEICQQFGIPESSLYRVLQRQGVSLRGRSAPRVKAIPAVSSPKDAGRVRRPRRVQTSRARSDTMASVTANRRGQFTIQFRAERLLVAETIGDALRQAQSLGTIDSVELTGQA